MERIKEEERLKREIERLYAQVEHLRMDIGHKENARQESYVSRNDTPSGAYLARPDGASAPRTFDPVSAAGGAVPRRQREISPVTFTSAIPRRHQEMSPAAPNPVPAMGGGVFHTPPRNVFKLPRYAGTTPLEPYLAQVKMAELHNGWSTQETAAHIALALEGKALQVLLDLMPHEQRDYLTLAAALERRFGQRISTEQMRDKLAHRRRMEGETLGAYAADVRYYTQRGYPTFAAAACEELALSAFIQGLTPERLKEHLRIKAPATLQGALEEAERVETVLTPHRSARPQVRQADIDDNESEDEGGTVRRAQPSSTPPPGPRQFPARPRTRQFTDACYRCGEPGHRARVCPAPAPRQPNPPQSGN